MPSFLCFENVSKSFGALRAVDDVTLDIARDEVFSLLGPSGCGKTTLLRLAAGFESPDSGRIMLDGRDITALPPEMRPVNTVFQNYALFPHLSVADNIAFGLRVAGRSKTDIAREVDAMLDLVRLRAEARKKPSQLSGGQKQRVAIARALINKPRVLLLDEPLAALDLKLRQHMLAELRAIHEAAGITFIYVTHDQTEAMGLSDRIAVMNAGRIEQVGPPAEIYDKPRTHFVAGFIGDANFLSGTVTATGTPLHCEINVPNFGRLIANESGGFGAGTTVEVIIRPEAIQMLPASAAASTGANTFDAVIDDIIPCGTLTRCVLRLNGISLIAELPRKLMRAGLARGSTVILHMDPADVFVMTRNDGTPAVGSKIQDDDRSVVIP